jgi:uncharacterized protein YkwD
MSRTPASWMRRTLIVGGIAALAAALLPVDTALASRATTSVRTAAGVVAPASDGDGYAWLNYFRHLAGEGSVARNATYEAQNRSHVHYLADASIGCETNVHDELTARVGTCGRNPAATAGGKLAANNSDIARMSGLVSDREAVSAWFTSAFHALALLDPRLTSTGYAAYYTPAPRGAGPMAWRFTAAVDVYRGRHGTYHGGVVSFPANGAASPLLAYRVGTESPEPFAASLAATACHGWAARSVVSAPIIVQWPSRAGVGRGAVSIVDLSTGRPEPTCALSAASYAPGSLPAMFLGGVNGITKAGLYYAANPFVAGHRYQLRVGGKAITTFGAVDLPSPAAVRVIPARRAAAMNVPAVGATPTLHRLYRGAGCSGHPVREVLASGTARIGRLVTGRRYSVRSRIRSSTGGDRWSNCQNFRPV